jgi:energy-converting hydrogenase Eha subunit A
MVTAFINPQVFTIAGIIAVILTATAVMLVKRARRPKRFSWKVEAALGVLVLASGWLVSTVTFNIQTGLMNSARQASIEETYGIKLGSDGLADLKAPRGAPPAPEEGKFTSFGVTQVVHERQVLTIFLSWDGEQFELRDEDGEPLPKVQAE